MVTIEVERTTATYDGGRWTSPTPHLLPLLRALTPEPAAEYGREDVGVVVRTIKALKQQGLSARIVYVSPDEPGDPDGDVVY
jgi:hypothetical protein